jgi:hypothetical protein
MVVERNNERTKEKRKKEKKKERNIQQLVTYLSRYNCRDFVGGSNFISFVREILNYSTEVAILTLY